MSSSVRRISRPVTASASLGSLDQRDGLRHVDSRVGVDQAELERRRLLLELAGGRAVDRIEAGIDVLSGADRVRQSRGLGVLGAGARPLAGTLRGEQRLFLRAARLRVAAAGREAATGRRAHQVGWDAGDGEERLRAVLVEPRNGAEQRLRVRVPHRAEEFLGSRALGDLPRVHDHHALRAGRDHPEVVRDEDHGHLEVAAEVVDQIEDLSLDRDVERRRGLVGDQQLRRVHERHRDHHALSQPAGELVRVRVQALRRPR